MLSDRDLNPIVTKMLTRNRKINISFVFIIQYYFAILENIILYSKQYFIMKISNKQKLQQITINNSSDIEFKVFMKLYKKLYCKTLFFLGK